MATSSTVASLELTMRIRRRREELGFKGTAVAKALGFTNTYWSHVENNRNVLTESKLVALMDFLDIDTERDELLELRNRAKERGWWAGYSGLFGDELLRLFGLEHGAQSIRTYNGLIVPGLLQTEEYARALICSDLANIRQRDAEQYVEVRMRRQQRLSGENPLELTAVISQAALMQQTGGSKVQQRQLQHMADMMNEHEDTIDVRVLPFTTTVGAILGASTFHLLGFPSPQLPTIAWHESVSFGSVVDDPDQVRSLCVTFGHAYDKALSRADSLDLIEEEARKLA